MDDKHQHCIYLEQYGAIVTTGVIIIRVLNEANAKSLFKMCVARYQFMFRFPLA